MILIKSALDGNLSAKISLSLLICAGITAPLLRADTTNPIPTLQIQADKITAQMPPTFYGLMTEEINYSYEGGLYGELIRNRTFKADAIQQPIKAENYDPAKYYAVQFPANIAPKFWGVINDTFALAGLLLVLVLFTRLVLVLLPPMLLFVNRVAFGV